ncbi:MAG: site-specific DNA-methyltransferase [Candidatus Parcubacteria bacterium]|nr:site-specific DNA-methyltransferase [Candidatus Parcubacteria bacterium]
MQTSKQKSSIKYGDIFTLGEHLLCCGNCTDTELVKRLLGNNKIKLILADVPYGVNFTQSKESLLKKETKHKDIVGDEDQSDEKYSSFTREWLEAIKPYLERKNAFYIFNSDKMIFSLRQGIENAGYNFGQLLIWVKSQAVIGRKDYLPMHELIAYGWCGTHEFMKSKAKSVLFYPKPQNNNLHPTMKPISLLRDLILNSTRIGDIVYDGFVGSGSTILSCEQTKRKCFAFEIEPDYCRVILERFEKLTGIKPKKLT